MLVGLMDLLADVIIQSFSILQFQEHKFRIISHIRLSGYPVKKIVDR